MVSRKLTFTCTFEGILFLVRSTVRDESGHLLTGFKKVF